MYGGLNIKPPADKTEKPANNETSHGGSKSLGEYSSEEFLQLLENASPEQLEALAAIKSTSPIAETSSNAAHQIVKPSSGGAVVPMVAWWESRRLLYNLIVGASGVPAVIVLAICGVPLLQLFFFGVLPYAFAANVCYTLGLPAELITRRLWKENATHVGPMLFTLGTMFSVLLTLALSGATILFGALFGLK